MGAEAPGVGENADVKLRRLAGYGPTAAYLSAGSLFVFFFILILCYPIAQAASWDAIPMTIVWFFALWLWLGALAVVVFDLEWLEHPATSTRWFQIAHWATLAALVVPVLLGIGLIANSGAIVSISFLLIGPHGWNHPPHPQPRRAPRRADVGHPAVARRRDGRGVHPRRHRHRDVAPAGGLHCSDPRPDLL
jgi:hypothetical protein